ncbi:MAG: dihydropteridine reductase [[Ruminococcus] gnavus]|nr:dihydropteridine reductase [Mediterraneibacter gnavus]
MNREVEKILAQYADVTTELTALEQLKALDRKVKSPANIYAYIFGSLGAMIMGTGMSLIMTDIGEMIGMKETMMPGIVIGIIGLIIEIANIPIYKKILNARKAEYANEIIELSNKIMMD